MTVRPETSQEGYNLASQRDTESDYTAYVNDRDYWENSSDISSPVLGYGSYFSHR
jgi:hypothetical protein